MVIVRFSSGVIHRFVGGPESSQGHAAQAFQAADWELFPNVVVAREAGHQLCQGCYMSPQPRWVTS